MKYNGTMHSQAIYRLARNGILLALAAAFSFLESLLPFPGGIRIGLSGLITMYALLHLRFSEALGITVLKSALAALTRGMTAGLLSFSGSMLSLLGMLLLWRLGSSLLLMSSLGGWLHNLGQLLCASILLQSDALFWYFPVLTAAGICSGVLTACLFHTLLPKLRLAAHFQQRASSTERRINS